MAYDSDIQCPKCFAWYELHKYKTIMRDKDTVYCDLCGAEVFSWNGGSMYQIKLKKDKDKTQQI